MFEGVLVKLGCNGLPLSGDQFREELGRRQEVSLDACRLRRLRSQAYAYEAEVLYPGILIKTPENRLISAADRVFNPK